MRCPLAGVDVGVACFLKLHVMRGVEISRVDSHGRVRGRGASIRGCCVAVVEGGAGKERKKESGYNTR